ncbi:hypothetical protein QNH46_13055 [Paenibacillus woosongensis]|uniref:Prenylated flavin chaperone LpdD-like domain-containing protein n=1 Tax=Paenibacillus woosongensis TaxID=307580 RepID=A0AA95HZP7_9BACL|nr:hypothetical protein [Paenibacillus woosongensis]WHX47106.1 hypothetical protein QNH46_13055 [Paenibacillus woosongensis]
MERFADIVLQEMAVGKDILFIVSGGERHIGASSTAYWNEGQIHVQTCAVPGHKEHVLSEGLAMRAAEMLRRTVTLVMGIHYDQLSREEINAISGHVSRLMDEFLLRQVGIGFEHQSNQGNE